MPATPAPMRPRSILVLAVLGTVAASGLSACSTTPAPTALASSSPLPVSGYDWHLNHDEAETSLAYGVAETDDVPLDLSCQPGSGRLDILHTVDKGQPYQIALESGGDTETYSAKAEPSALHDGVDLTASAASNDPVFLRFRKLGWLAVHTDKARLTLVAQPGTLPQIEHFFSLCDRAS